MKQAPDEVIAAAAAEGRGEEIATDPETAPAYMAQAVLGFTEQLERIGEVAVMLLVGVMISVTAVPSDALWFVPLLLLVIRAGAAALGMIGSTTTWLQRAFIAWFGIRGIGSIYYLMYAIAHGISDANRQAADGADACGCRHLGGRTWGFRDAADAAIQRRHKREG